MSRSVRYVLDTTPPVPATVPVLDDAQQLVVDHRGGPLLVLAGPGTGKTTTLVEAVVDRVDRDGLSPEQVLVLTFSRKAADELRERITTRLDRTVGSPSASTFHSWCYALVRAYSSTPDAEPPRLLSGAERDARVHELLKGNADGDGRTRWPERLRPALRLRGFAREVADLLDRCRERGLDSEMLRQLGLTNERAEWVSAADFLDEYLDVLDTRGELDYAGLVSRAGSLLALPEIGSEVAGRYAAVFVDEYQDTDPAQEALLQTLAGAGRELVVVGDPDQSIYAFRGADVRGIQRFPDRFRQADGSPARVIALQTSRRAGEPLLRASRALASRIPVDPGLKDGMRAHRALTASGPLDSRAPEVHVYPTVAEEVTAIADLLRRAHLEDGVPWREMAVLVRSGVRSIPVLRRAFASSGVPITVAADEVVLARDPTVAPLLAALQVAVRGWAGVNTETAEALLLSPLGRVQPMGLRALGRRLRALERDSGVDVPRPSSELVAEALRDPRDLATMEDWVADPVRRLHRLLDRAMTQVAEKAPPEEVLWELWEGSGWGRRLARASAGGGDEARAADRDLDAALALFGAAGRLQDRLPRATVGALLEEVKAQQLPAPGHEERPGAGDAVRLLTAHRAKGLEWDVVVVSGVQDGVWPDLRVRGSLLDAQSVSARGELRPPPTHGDLLADEWRLFYVACTRARRRLVVTAVESLDDAGERPSRFVDTLRDHLVPARAAGAAARPSADDTGSVDRPAGEHPGTQLLAMHSLVARLRRAVQDEASSDAVRTAAAQHLAALATATDETGRPLVPAADPAAWWGLLDLTPGGRPVRPVDEPVLLSASGVASFDRCSLRWFLEREVRAQSTSSSAQGFGTVVHALAQAVADGSLPAEPDALRDALDTVWSRLGFEAPWQQERDRREALAVLDRFLRWHDAGEREVLSVEQDFDVTVGDVRLRGAVDRLERDASGATHVVDLKTGRSAPANKDLPTDAQLGVYQVAAREGAFGDVVVGGAELVQLRHELKGGVPKVQRQEPLAEGPGWADELLDRVAGAVRAETFAARPGTYCGGCSFITSCPAHDEGRQVLPWQG